MGDIEWGALSGVNTALLANQISGLPLRASQWVACSPFGKAGLFLMEPPIYFAWSADNSDLLVSFSKENIEDDHFYYMPWLDLMTPKGQAYWFRHLSEKTWFTESVEKDMAAMIRERSFSHE